jgi:hypothetical protein
MTLKSLPVELHLQNLSHLDDEMKWENLALINQYFAKVISQKLEHRLKDVPLVEKGADLRLHINDRRSRLLCI